MTKIKSKVVILGSGTCRIDPHRAESSVCFIDSDTTFLFDCGSSVPRRLVEAGGLSSCRSLHIHLSHSHVDHIAGLPALLQCLTFSDDPRDLKIEEVVIHSSFEVKNIVQGILELLGDNQTNLVGYYPSNNRIVRFETFGNEDDTEYLVNNVLVKSVHLPGAFNHGVKFEINSLVYAITGDSTEFNDKLIDFCRNADRVVFDFGHLTNIKNENEFGYSTENISKLLLANSKGHFYAGHVYLRCLQGHKESLSYDERVIEANKLIRGVIETTKEFSGSIELAEDLKEI